MVMIIRMIPAAREMPIHRSLSVLEAKVRSQKLDCMGVSQVIMGWFMFAQRRHYQKEVVRQDGNRQDVKKLPTQKAIL